MNHTVCAQFMQTLQTNLPYKMVLKIVTLVEDMKSPKEDYEIRKSVVSYPGTGEDLLIFLSFYTLVI